MMAVSVISNLVLASYARGIYDGPYQELEAVANIEKNIEALQKNIYLAIAELDTKKISGSVNEIKHLEKELQANVKTLKAVAPGDHQSEIDKFRSQIKKNIRI